MKWTIANKLIAGFASVSLILVVIVYLNYSGLQENETLVTRVIELRSPTAQASYKVLNGINQSLAGLRGWMLLKDSKFKTVRKDAWSQYIDSGMDEMDELSKSWTNPENLKRLKEMKAHIEDFRRFQKEIEDMANTNENIPAFNLLLTKAAPQATIMSRNITTMIDMELKSEATALRKSILGMMADIRGTLGLGLANIRAYLLTGDTEFRDKFLKLWEKNDRRFRDLSDNYANLSPSQKSAFNTFKSAREEFVNYPKQMFKLRGAEDWNIANHWLKIKAAPVAGSIMATLSDLVANQKELLTVDNTALAELSQTMKRTSIILAIIGLLVALMIAVFIIRSIIQPLARMNDNISSIAKGDLTIEVDDRGSDEIAVAMKNMKKMVAKLKDVIGFVITSANNIASASSEMSSSSQQVSEGATEQASSAEEVSSSMEQMAANIQQNTDNAKQTEKISEKSAIDMKEGGDAVKETVESMKTIASKISIIGEIAGQTNLLALNAAVEAARAGEHGKGFAVVAAEVRKLAERSQLAAAEIDEVSASSVAVAEKSGKLLEEIVPNIQKTSELVQEISAASIEQNAGADQVNNAIQQLNEVVQQNAAASEEMAASAEELNVQADQLKDAVSYFKIGDSMTKTQNYKRQKSVALTSHPVDMGKVKSTAVKKTKNITEKENGSGLDIDMKDDGNKDKEFEKF